MEHSAAVHQNALANQMNQMHISAGSQYVTSPVQSSFPQNSWQVVQHSAAGAQGQHHHAQHYVGMEVYIE